MTTDAQKLSAYAQFESDAALEAAGVWRQIGTMEFLIARAGGENEDFLKTAGKRFKPYQAALAAETMPKELARDLVIDVFVDTILKDWRGVFDRDGVELPFSKENAKRLLRDLPNLFAALQAESQKQGNFRRANVEEAAKNL